MTITLSVLRLFVRTDRKKEEGLFLKEYVTQKLFRVGAFRWVSFQAGSDEVLEIIAKMVRDLGYFVTQRNFNKQSNVVIVVVLTPRSLTSRHFKHCASQSPNIRSAAAAGLLDDFWSHPRYAAFQWIVYKYFGS